MRRLTVFLSLLLLSGGFAYSQQPTPDKSKLIVPGTGAYTEDGGKILRAAVEVIKSVKTLSYEAVYETNGSMSTRSPRAVGNVRIARLPSENPLKAQIAARGLFTASGSDEKTPFDTTFDGQRVQKMRSRDKTVVTKMLSSDDPRERTLGYVTSFFGGGPYQLLMLEYLIDTPFSRQIGASVIDYEGRTVVEGVLCHVVYVEYSVIPGGKVQKERWFFGMKDSLPRRSEIIVSDNEGRYGAYALRLTNLRTNIALGQRNFAVKLPTGFSNKPFAEPPKITLLSVGEIAPNWKLVDGNGVERQLSDYRGKVVVMDFWATWCGPCLRAMPVLQKIYERFKDRGVEVFGVNAWEDSNSAEFMKRAGYTYGLLQKGETIADAYHIPSLPTLYVVGADGKIIHSVKGLDDNLDEHIEAYLKAVGK